MWSWFWLLLGPAIVWAGVFLHIWWFSPIGVAVMVVAILSWRAERGRRRLQARRNR
jgi:hypothetical protein